MTQFPPDMFPPELREELMENQVNFEAYSAYVENIGIDYATLEGFEEAFVGKFSNDEDFVREICSAELQDAQLPPYIYIDWERTARNLMHDFFESDGYYFRNY